MSNLQSIDYTDSLEALSAEFDQAACAYNRSNVDNANDRAQTLIMLLNAYIAGSIDEEFRKINQTVEREYILYQGELGLAQVGVTLSINGKQSEFLVTETRGPDKTLRYHTSNDLDIFIVIGQNTIPSEFIMDKLREACLKLLTPIQQVQLSVATAHEDSIIEHAELAGRRFLLN